MPTNLPAEAKKKWSQASQARNPKQKLERMREFLSLVPKHKGTEKLRAQIKTKIAALRKEVEARESRKASVWRPKFLVEKEGAAQIVILGQTNVGRSSLLSRLTNAKVRISSSPFTTKRSVPGMFVFENVQFQIVEAPAIVEGKFDQQTFASVRNADGLILMVGLDRNPVEQLSLIREKLETARVLIRKPSTRLIIERKHFGFGLRVFATGRLVDCTIDQVEGLLRSYGVTNAVVKIHGNITLDDVEDSIFGSVVFRPSIIVANKLDTEGARRRLGKLKSYINDHFEVVATSCKTSFGLDKLGLELFKTLEIIRVYTKEPASKEYSPKPFILKKNATIEDLAKQIHSDFYSRFSYAKVWSSRLSFSPRKTGLSFVLDDNDIVEIHVK